ncbi:MAG: hypothetical protein AAGG81_03635 [Chlamydiota bacterium]
MKDTVPTLPEVGYRCRVFTEGRIHSSCLIEGIHNPSDAMTKNKPNNTLLQSIRTNKLVTPVKRVFMLQTCPFRHCPWIPTSNVPMSNDPCPAIST